MAPALTRIGEIVIFQEGECKVQAVGRKAKKFIEPFVELGLISPHPLVVLWNEGVAVQQQ
jgi:hypothetical protein